MTSITQNAPAVWSRTATPAGARQAEPCAILISSFFPRTIHFADWHMDPKHSASVARLSHDGIGPAVGLGRICQPDPNFSVGAARRANSGSRRPEEGCNGDTSLIPTARIYVGASDIERKGAGVCDGRKSRKAKMRFVFPIASTARYVAFN